MRDTPDPMTDRSARIRGANRKTAGVLLSIAVVFFVGVIATRFMGEGATGIVILGTIVLLFLVVAIGRNLREAASGAGRSLGPKGASARDAAGADAQARDLAGPAHERPR